MTAVDRITATLAKHYDVTPTGVSWPHWRCRCGHTLTHNGFAPEAEHAAHVAERIAAADDLAVIELPARAPSTVEYWEAPVQVHRDSFGIHMGALIRFPAAGEAVRQAAALLAAVKAAEAVSDRGDN